MMSTTHRDKSGGKPRQRSRKTDQRGQKPEPQQSPKLDQPHEDYPIEPVIASTEVTTNGATAPVDVPPIADVEPAEARSTAAAVPADNPPVNIQTIANAYGDYTRKSLQESRSLVEKLMGTRSLEKAIEIQTEFARQAYANFVAESQKICGLYGELARQAFRPWEGFAVKNGPGRRQIS
jgi:hypothetical protein